jgi:hypothetical protein
VLRDGRKIREGRPGAYGRFLAHSLMVLDLDLPAYRAVQRAFVQRVAERGLLGGSGPVATSAICAGPGPRRTMGNS